MKPHNPRPITGRQIIAARALAGLPTREFCKLARISPLTLHKLESMDTITPGDDYHSPVRRTTLAKIVAALSDCGVRLCTEHHGVHLRR